jgi:hypothetical protein
VIQVRPELAYPAEPAQQVRLVPLELQMELQDQQVRPDQRVPLASVSRVCLGLPDLRVRPQVRRVQRVYKVQQERPEKPARRVVPEQEKQVQQEKLEVRVPRVSPEKQELLDTLGRQALQELRELRDYLGPQVKVVLRALPDKQVLLVRLELPERLE